MFTAVLRVYVQCLELTIEMGPFHPNYLGQFADIAANLFQMMKQVVPLKIIACFAQ